MVEAPTGHATGNPAPNFQIPPKGAPHRTKVLVVDDHAVVRAGLISLIDRAEDLELCGEAATESETLARARATQPDVAVVDWSLGRREASSLVKRLRTEFPHMPVLILSMHDERFYAERAVEVGASGYVMKHEASGRIVSAIRALASGRRFFSGSVAAALDARAAVPASAPPASEPPKPGPRTVTSPGLPGWASRAVVVAILLAIGCALYEFTLPFPFAFDDHVYLVKNPLSRDPQSFLFFTEFTDFANRATRLGLEKDLSTNFILRPLAYLTFYLNYLAGGLAPAGYRAVNVLIHSANAALIFALVTRLLRAARGATPSSLSARFMAWTAALLFLVHPLQTESVTYVIQRFTSLGTFFFLGSVLLFLMAHTEENAALARRRRHWSLAALLAGMLTKEFVFLAPLAMVLLDCVVLETPVRAALKRARPWLLCMPLIPVLVIAVAAAQGGQGVNLAALREVTSPNSAGSGAISYQWQYALTQPSVILTYLGLLFLPRGLNLDPVHPFTTSALDGRFVGPLLGILVLIGAGFWLATRREGDYRLRIAGFGVLWFFLSLSIDSSVIPLPDVMAEHRAYLPSVGFFIAVACLADIGRTWRAGQSRLGWIVPVAAALAALALAIATVARNQVWRSSISLWKDTVAKSPGKIRAWMNLGTAFFEAERWSRAIECYQRSIALDPANGMHWGYLAIAQNAAGRYERALASADEGFRRNSKYSNLYLARAFACERLGRKHDALATLEAWAREDPSSTRARLGLAGLSFEVGDLAGAEQHLKLLRALGSLSEEQQAAAARLEASIAARRATGSAAAQRSP